MRRIRFLIRKELIELRRDPRLFAIVIVAPILQLFLLTYAATTDIRNVPVVFVDHDRSTESRALVSRFTGSPSFTVRTVLTDPAAIEAYLEHGTAWLAITIPDDYGHSLREREPAVVQVIADGSDANSAGVALGYASTLITAFAQEHVGVRPVLEPRVRVWFNPQLESRFFMVPGVVALLLLVVTTNLSSMAIVREKEIGTLEQLNVTPLSRTQLILGKLLPYALVGIVDVVLVITVAVFWFEVPLRGSVVELFGLSLVYLLTTLGLGLFVSTISATQQQAMMTTTFFFLMPMVMLSGFVFPIENMPYVIQQFTYLIPLRYFLVILRSIFLKGAGLATFWPEALALMAWGVAMLGLAIARSSKRAA